MIILHGLLQQRQEVVKELFDINGRQQPRFSINTDLSPYDMAPAYFSAGNNVRFLDGKAGKILGHIQVLGAPGSSNNPYWAVSWLQGYYRPLDLWYSYGTTEDYRNDPRRRYTVFWSLYNNS